MHKRFPLSVIPRLRQCHQIVTIEEDIHIVSSFFLSLLISRKLKINKVALCFGALEERRLGFLRGVNNGRDADGQRHIE